MSQVPAGARITERLRNAAGRRVRDAGSTVVQAARDLGLSWPTVMHAFRVVGQEVSAAALEPVEVLGIDETRRGRMQWRQNPETGRWEPAADRWHTGFVDAFGVQGLLGQVEGRAPSDVLAWLATTPLEWRRQISYVAIDMSASYRAAIHSVDGQPIPHPERHVMGQGDADAATVGDMGTVTVRRGPQGARGCRAAR